MGTDCTGKTNITVRNNITDVGVMLGDASTGAPRECSATMSNNRLNTNPLMIDPTGGNYKLQSGSSARGTGNATSALSVDYNGVPYNGVYDIGAYAYVNTQSNFNFAISNSGALEVKKGSSVSNTITASLVSGTTQSILFSASGLPPASTSTYSSASGSPSCKNTLTIKTSSSTPEGNYNITITGTGGGITKTTNFYLTVKSSLVAPQAFEMVSSN